MGERSMSMAVSAKYGVPCTTCKAAKNEPCRTRKTGRITDTHLARREAWNVRVTIWTANETPANAPTESSTTTEPETEGVSA